MKRTFILTVMAAVLVFGAAIQVSAKSWRVNSNASMKPHFADLNAAMSSDEVQAGDTLYLDPGCTLSSAQTITKAVTIVGPGYFLDSYPYYEALISGSLNLNAANTKIEGLHVSGSITAGADSISIERCYIGNHGTSWSGATFSSINLRSHKNCFVRQCMIFGNIYNGSTQCRVENCIIN